MTCRAFLGDDHDRRQEGEWAAYVNVGGCLLSFRIASSDASVKRPNQRGDKHAERWIPWNSVESNNHLLAHVKRQWIRGESQVNQSDDFGSLRTVISLEIFEISDRGSYNANSVFRDVEALVSVPRYHRDCTSRGAPAQDFTQTCASFVRIEEIRHVFPFYAIQERTGVQRYCDFCNL